jgi:hypothetical protein
VVAGAKEEDEGAHDALLGCKLGLCACMAERWWAEQMVARRSPVAPTASKPPAKVVPHQYTCMCAHPACLAHSHSEEADLQLQLLVAVVGVGQGCLVVPLSLLQRLLIPHVGLQQHGSHKQLSTRYVGCNYTAV